MKLVLLLVVLAVLAFVAYMVFSAYARSRAEAARWRVATKTASDGSLRVVLEGPDGGERLVKELPASLEGPELTGELRLAREEAFMQAEELNRPGP
ncbi:MAG TPA: hypothetical protein VGW10_05900 [Solirubrobacteraceae bacterium]|nr:hypothetical protein [Solirubrobacteraceae bacterium]